MFYLMQNTKYLIILGEMLPGRLELGELGHFDRMSHCSVKFPVGTDWLGSLLNLPGMSLEIHEHLLPLLFA